MDSFYEWQGDQLLLRITVRPKARKDEFCGPMGNCLKVRIIAPPVDGKANLHLIKFLAKQFKVSQSQVILVSGDTSRDKRFRISRPEHLPESLNIICAECQQTSLYR